MCEPSGTLCASYFATSLPQKGASQNSAVRKILHLICDDSALSCFKKFSPPRPRAAQARTRVLKCSHRGRGHLLVLGFTACCLFGKCIIARTNELPRYHWRTLCLPCVTVLGPLEFAKGVLRCCATRERPCALKVIGVPGWCQEEVHTH